MALRNQRRGTTIAVLAVILPILVVIIGFSVDVAYMQQVRTELRVATDLAAKAASAELAQSGDVALARAAGKSVALENSVGGAALQLDDVDFDFGKTTQQANGKWTFDTAGVPENSVQVLGRRTSDSANGSVDLFFSKFLRAGSFQPRTNATASFINVDICLVLDRSSSMKLATTTTENSMAVDDPRVCDTPRADSRWTALDAAVDIFITQLTNSLANENVGLVTFGSDFTVCDVSNPAARMESDLTSTLSTISGAMTVLSGEIWNGNTEIDAGIARARQVLTGSEARANAKKVMVVFTDGAYTGDDPVPEATLAHQNGIQVHTVTYSIGANEDDMLAVATAGGGNHYHAPDETSLNNIFKKIAGSITILTE